MEKLYGYNSKDVYGLMCLVKEKKNKSLTDVFREYSLQSGKSEGTVRNIYYGVIKSINADRELLEKFGLSEIKVNSPKVFSETDEKELIKEIFKLKKQGYSVRRAVTTIANGDVKLALRYQNKYRNTLSKNPDLVSNVITELGDTPQPTTAKITDKANVSEFQMQKLKKEINGLIERISESLRQENAKLKKRIGDLQMENLRLKSLLYNTQNANLGKNIYFTRYDKIRD